MEPRSRPSQELTASRLRFAIRLAAACALLVGLAMVQSPGLLVPDTKFDLAIAPGQFLSRATHLWDPLGAFGQLQNQAYGYLWPMGPFFLLGSVLDIPGWVIQRLWMALVMCVAMTGTVKLARVLGVRSEIACLVGGFAYALSPRMLTTLGPISIEAWPSALAPWVLVPLVVGSTRGSARRAAALAALAVAMVGGVNAAATFAVLPLGVLWLLTRTPGPRRRTLMLWWPVFTALGTLWWLVPLFVMGAYSPPFLDYIESAANTTFPTTLFDSLRGTSNWVPYVDSSSRAGNDLLRQFFLPINSSVVLFLGLAGILQRRNPHRLFLALGTVLGLVMVTFGHLGSVQGWLAGDLNALLDGALAPLRNVHKFDPILRLPLVLGLVFLVDSVREQLVRGAVRESNDTLRVSGLVHRVNLQVVIGTAILAVLGAALPAVAGRITPAGGLQEVPDYWTQAASWLDDEQGTTLLVPGSSFGDYVWGSPRDEPMQSLASSPWAVRNAVPLTPPGNIRMLDAVEERLSQGVGSDGLAAHLRRAGVSHLLVRNDLARSADVPDPVLVHQALADSAGLRRVATFGPDVGGEANLKGKGGVRVLVNGGWQNNYPAIEIFEVEGYGGQAVSSDHQPVVVGGPEDLLDLADLGILSNQPAMLAVDAPLEHDPQAPLVLTDGQRAVERNFGRVHDGASATLVPGEERRLGNPTRDYLLDDADRWSTYARIDGASAVTASSSMSDANAFGTLQRGQLPYAALDGDPATAWTSNYQAGEPAWWQVDFEGPREVRGVAVTAGPDQREVLVVRTAERTTTKITLNPGATRIIAVDDPAAGWLRIEDASGRFGNRSSVAEVGVLGLDVRRSLVLPATPVEWGNPDAIVLRAVLDGRTGCVEIDSALRCVIGREVSGEEQAAFRRALTLPLAEDFDARIAVRARPGTALDNLLLDEQPIGVSASSSANPDTRASVLAAFDGDLGTTWTAAFADLRPVLRMNWLGKRRVTGLELAAARDTAARLPEELTLIWPGGRRDVSVRGDGVVRFPAFRTDQLTIRVLEAEPATSLDFNSVASEVPVGIGELDVAGVPFLPIAVPAQARLYPCGSGPEVVVNGRTFQTSVTASPAQLFSGETVPAELCDVSEVGLTAGTNEIDVIGSDTFVPTSLVLTSGVDFDESTLAVGSVQDGPVKRVVVPDGAEAADGVVVLAENTNQGWSAVQAGRSLEAVVVDGWKQGWRLETADDVAVRFGPDRAYRWGLFGGLVTLVALMLIACLPAGRWPDPNEVKLKTRRASVLSVGVLAALGGGLVAGWLGALLGIAGCLVSQLVVRRVPETGRWLLAAIILPSGLAYALRPWGGQNGWAGSLEWPHYLVVVVCGAVLGWAGEGGFGLPAPLIRSLSRMPGLSTKR